MSRAWAVEQPTRRSSRRRIRRQTEAFYRACGLPHTAAEAHQTGTRHGLYNILSRSGMERAPARALPLLLLFPKVLC